MSRENKILYNWRSILITFPVIFLYFGFLPMLKLLGLISINWCWALAPIWLPFAAFWTIVGFITVVAFVLEIGFIILPDENFIDNKE